MGKTIEIETARYLDHLTVERGLSANTIGAYRRDLARYRRFLEARDIRAGAGRRGDRPRRSSPR